jgi:hypothetical protein
MLEAAVSLQWMDREVEGGSGKGSGKGREGGRKGGGMWVKNIDE